MNAHVPAKLERAARLGLAHSGLIDLVVTPHLHLASLVCGEKSRRMESRGRGRVIMAVFRHPVRRRAATEYRALRLQPGG